MTSWMSNFTDREIKEIEFAVLYKSRFAHGTDGHNAKIIIAKMAAMLDNIEEALHPRQYPDTPYFHPGGVSLRRTAPPALRWTWDGQFEDDEE